jgi:hypothetical protein
MCGSEVHCKCFGVACCFHHQSRTVNQERKQYLIYGKGRQQDHGGSRFLENVGDTAHIHTATSFKTGSKFTTESPQMAKINITSAHWKKFQYECTYSYNIGANRKIWFALEISQYRHIFKNTSLL